MNRIEATKMKCGVVGKSSGGEMCGLDEQKCSVVQVRMSDYFACSFPT